MSEFRRRLMMVGGGEKPIPVDSMGYILAGQTLHLDGIENTNNGHDSTSSTWYDHVSGANFNKGTKLVWGTNNIYCTTKVSPWENMISADLTLQLHTISILYKFQSDVYTFLTDKLRIYGNVKGAVYINTWAQYNYANADYNNPFKMDIVVIGKTIYFYGNGQLLRTGSVNGVVTCTKLQLGGGTWYSIMIYDRALTSDEILYNYNNDVNRFGL